MRKLLYTDFAREVEEAGLIARHCALGHWQILDGEHHPLVNVWPNGKRGFGMAPGNGKRRPGSVRVAIALAGPRLPERKVGLIGWLWRWLY